MADEKKLPITVLEGHEKGLYVTNTGDIMSGLDISRQNDKLGETYYRASRCLGLILHEIYIENEKGDVVALDSLTNRGVYTRNNTIITESGASAEIDINTDILPEDKIDQKIESMKRAKKWFGLAKKYSEEELAEFNSKDLVDKYSDILYILMSDYFEYVRANSSRWVAVDFEYTLPLEFDIGDTFEAYQDVDDIEIELLNSVFPDKLKVSLDINLPDGTTLTKDQKNNIDVDESDFEPEIV